MRRFYVIITALGLGACAADDLSTDELAARIDGGAWIPDAPVRDGGPAWPDAPPWTPDAQGPDGGTWTPDAPPWTPDAPGADGGTWTPDAPPPWTPDAPGADAGTWTPDAPPPWTPDAPGADAGTWTPDAGTWPTPDAGTWPTPDAGVPPNQATGDDILPGEILAPGTEITSASGRYSLRFEQGRLAVVRNGILGRTVWTSTNRIATSCTLQSDGNFVLSNAAGGTVWSTQTFHGRSYVKIRNDGTAVVIRRAGNVVVWSSPLPTFP